MIAKYKTDTGIIETFLWNDLLRDDCIRRLVQISKINSHNLKNPIKKTVNKDEKGLYFIWDGKRVYIRDFEYPSPDELFHTLADENKYISEDDMLAAFMKNPDKFLFVAHMPVFDVIIPPLGFYFTGNDEQKAVCRLSDSDISTWHYKVKLEPLEFEEGRIAPKTFYFTDLHSMILNGSVEIVLVDDMLAKTLA